MKSIIIIYNNTANNEGKKESLQNKKLLYDPKEKSHRKLIFLPINTFFCEKNTKINNE